MQLLNGQIVHMFNAINEISEKDLPVEFAFKVFEIASKLTPHFQSYLQTIQKLMKKNNVDDPEDPVIRQDVVDLMNVTVEMNCELIDKQELIDSGIKLTLSQLQRLDPIIKEE